MQIDADEIHTVLCIGVVVALQLPSVVTPEVPRMSDIVTCI